MTVFVKASHRAKAYVRREVRKARFKGTIGQGGRDARAVTMIRRAFVRPGTSNRRRQDLIRRSLAIVRYVRARS